MFLQKASILLAVVCASATSFDPRLTLDGNRATISFGGAPGSEYIVQQASELPVALDEHGHNHAWRTLGSLRLTGDVGQWQTDFSPFGNRFFRVGLIEAPDLASNFRMIDQNGVSRELHYFRTAPELRAIVLTFTDGTYAGFASKIAELKSNPTYSSAVLFWTIDVSEGKTREQIAAAAQAAGITWPVFQDPSSLTTRDYDAHFNAETFLINRQNLRIVYRGAIDNGAGENYLANAMASLFANQAIDLTRVEPAAGELPHRDRPVADYATVIAPILQNKCVTCHSPDNIAPFAMTSHQSVQEYASLIKSQIMSKKMPPWHADPHYGSFRNDVSLTEQETAQLLDWIAAGVPRGEGPDPLTDVPPEPPEWPVELGPPDEIVTVPTETIPATGTVAYRYRYVYSANQTDRWVKAAIAKPSNRRVVHHYLVWQGHLPFGFTGMAGYAPGRTEGAYPEGTGVLLPARSPLTFNLHYTATGQVETDQPKMALWYYTTPPPRAVQSAVPLNTSFAIPPGARDHQVTAEFNFNQAATIYSFNPHMHFRGLRMKFNLVLPNNGGTRTLISVPKYDFNWQTIYYLAEPLDVPAGSRIDIVGAFDNSAQNTFNPNPGVTVRWGEQSWEEMFIGYMEYANR